MLHTDSTDYERFLAASGSELHCCKACPPLLIALLHAAAAVHAALHHRRADAAAALHATAAAAQKKRRSMRRQLCVLFAARVAGLRFARRVRFWKGPKKAPVLSAPAAAGSEAASHGRSATPLELERIQTARSRIDDAWVSQRSDRELLPFARACSTADQLATRLRDTAAWRREWARTEEDWSFDTFFTERRDAFYRDIELEGEMMEWLGGESNPPCTTKEGASLLILRPARYMLGTVEKEDWLRLIAWHGARATSEWPSDADTDKPGHGAVAIVVDRTCSGVRNQDPRLLRFLLPPLI